jgi:hypothetical protein
MGLVLVQGPQNHAERRTTPHARRQAKDGVRLRLGLACVFDVRGWPVPVVIMMVGGRFFIIVLAPQTNQAKNK